MQYIGNRQYRGIQPDNAQPDNRQPLNALHRELIRYATLAASSHNTQCWKFILRDQQISILPDLARQCPVVDPDCHHLYASLGCATENLLLSAQAHGLLGTVSLTDNSASASAINVHLEAAKPTRSLLYDAITQRQSARSIYDGQPLKLDELKQLERAGTSEGVNVILLTQKAALATMLDYILAGNTAQIKDPAFVKELKSWIRFNPTEAAKKRRWSLLWLYGQSFRAPLAR